ncbi:cytochrome c [Reichenbachiella agarivorans]|uniref:Cytochrome c n=1 Tax=Reichenbachiella agarivorans TaxID=2979464 RepID=A0ABY6CLB8_9BACT|nr:cytochrome c [Reichenbachiella agarivorans]UXP30880.1 cytochrome c [Reichenbachiella agarivorans]
MKSLLNRILLLTLFALFSCKATNQDEIKLKQYSIEGKSLYATHCANCHQIDGSGLGQLIPPIDSTFLASNMDHVICGIKHGMIGSLTIQDKVFDGQMPANERLTPLEIAEIVTYIDNTWGKKSGIIHISQVETSLSLCQ